MDGKTYDPSVAIAVHVPCTSCNSSDGMCVYNDGHTFCYVCNTYCKVSDDKIAEYSNNKETTRTRGTPPNMDKYNQDKAVVPVLPSKGVKGSIKDRCIVKDTVVKYGVGLGVQKGAITHHFYPYYNAEGDIIAYKDRIVATKDFVCQGSIGKALLFGQQLFPAGSAKSITIYEGEIDAMSGYQLEGGFPCVSIKSGASSAYTACREQLEYLESFDNIVLCFDADRPGQEAARKCASLFTPGKAKIFKHAPGYKDANEYLVKGQQQLFKKHWWNAETYAPDGIVPSSSLRERILNRRLVHSVPYPWPSLNAKTYGIRRGEVVLLCARRGVGKTQLLREITYSILKNEEGSKVGTLYLEEQPEDSGLGMVSIEANLPMHLPDTEYTDDEFNEAFDVLMKDNRIYFYDSFGQNNLAKLLGRMRYYVKACGCNYLIVDHLGIIASDHSTGDERKKLDDAITAIKQLSVELDVAIFCTIHLNREGQVRGSDGPENYANIAINIDREVAADDETVRRTTKLTVTKNRFYGAGTGPAGNLYGNPTTGRLEEINDVGVLGDSTQEHEEVDWGID